MFARNVTENVQVGGEVVVIRKLSAKSLEGAAQARQIEIAQTSQRLGADLIRVFSDQGPKKDDKIAPPEPSLEQREKARYSTYDRFRVLTAGILSWTFKDAKGKPLPLTEVDDIDEENAEDLKIRILKLSLPALDPAVAENAGKNDSGPSTNS